MNKLELPDIRILVVNSHSALRKGFCSMLQSCNDLFSIYEATNEQQALQLLQRVQPNLVLLDAALPQIDCIESARMIASLQPKAKILAIADTEEDFMRAFQAGASGCIFGNIETEELLHAVELVLSGYVVYKKLILRPVGVDSSAVQERLKLSNIDMNLTEREVEVLSLIALEYTNTQIAKRLFISPRTVDSHRARLMQKLGTKNTAGLVRLAIERGLLNNLELGVNQQNQVVQVKNNRT